MGLDTNDPVWKVIFDLATILNFISVGCASMILFLLLILAIYDYRAVNRSTLRLQGGVAFIVILNHINNIYHWILPPNSGLCEFSGFFRLFGRQVYCFLNIAIALNLQLILLNGLTPNPRWEYYYWSLPVIVPLIMNVPPYVMGFYGFDGDRCFVKKDNMNARNLIITVNLTFVMFFTIAYLTVISGMVMIQLNRKLRIVQNITSTPQQPYYATTTPSKVQNDIEARLKQLIFRISLYPIVCVLSMLGYLVANIAYQFGYEEFLPIFEAAILGLTLTGMLNLLAFLLDPTFHTAFKSLINNMKSKDIIPFSRHNQRSLRIQSMVPAPNPRNPITLVRLNNDLIEGASDDDDDDEIEVEKNWITHDIAHRTSVVGNNKIRLL